MKRLNALLMLMFFSVAPAYAQPVTNWGDPLFEAQLSIAISTNVITVDSPAVVQCRIKNSSTNIVCVLHPKSPWANTLLILSDNSGKIYQLTPNPDQDDSFFTLGVIGAGESYEWSAPLKITQDIGPGDYQIKAVRRIFVSLNATNNPGGKLVSNSLNLQVK